MKAAAILRCFAVAYLTILVFTILIARARWDEHVWSKRLKRLEEYADSTLPHVGHGWKNKIVHTSERFRGDAFYFNHPPTNLVFSNVVFMNFGRGPSMDIIK